MHTVPKSLFALWSDYRSAAQDTELFLASHLDGVDDLAQVPIDLDLVAEAGIESAATAAMVARALATVRTSCAGGSRYFHNVAVRQSIGFTERDLVCTPSDFSGIRVRDPRPIATEAVPDDRVIMVDAPLFVSAAGMYLADYPPFVERPGDPRLALEVSERLRAEASRFCRDDQYPCCRTVGIYTERGGRPRLKVLEFLVRTPRTTSDPWRSELLEEVRTAAFGPGVEFELWRTELLSALEDLWTRARANDPGLIESEAAPGLLRFLPEPAADKLRTVRSRENTVYDGDPGLWAWLAVVLAGWPREFALSPSELRGLLREFDRAYDEAWSTKTTKLAATGEIRFTPAVMADIRRRIAALPETADPRDEPT